MKAGRSVNGSVAVVPMIVKRCRLSAHSIVISMTDSSSFEGDIMAGTNLAGARSVELGEGIES